jgi:hypothetical protein
MNNVVKILNNCSRMEGGKPGLDNRGNKKAQLKVRWAEYNVPGGRYFICFYSDLSSPVVQDWNWHLHIAE